MENFVKQRGASALPSLSTDTPIRQRELYKAIRYAENEVDRLLGLGIATANQKYGVRTSEGDEYIDSVKQFQRWLEKEFHLRTKDDPRPSLWASANDAPKTYGDLQLKLRGIATEDDLRQTFPKDEEDRAVEKLHTIATIKQGILTNAQTIMNNRSEQGRSGR